MRQIHCSGCGGWVSYGPNDPGYECEGFTGIEQLIAERDAWKILHDSRLNTPYGYASQEQLMEIRAAKAILGIK